MGKIKNNLVDKAFDDFDYIEKEYLKTREGGGLEEEAIAFLDLDTDNLKRAIEKQQEILAGLLKSLKEFQENLNRGFKDLNEDVSVF